MDWTADQLQCARNLCAIAWARRSEVGSDGVPASLMLSVCLQECGLNDQAVGDSGQSFGTYQLYQQVHPGTADAARDPWRDYAYPEVRARWERTYRDMGGDFAWANIARRAEFVGQFAPAAQGSIPWTDDEIATRYPQAVNVMEACS